NIKILLNELVASGQMTLEQRNRLLEDMTDEGARLVLDSNYKQTQAISLARTQVVRTMIEYRRFISVMESGGRLSRSLEGLPDDAQMAEQASTGQGLTWPELAVLVSYAKADLQGRLVDAPELDDPMLAATLQRAFPRQMVEGHADSLGRHKLRCEIIATQLAN